MQDDGSDRSRQEAALRTITVSARSALRKQSDAHHRARIRDRADDLLADLEEAVRADGAASSLLERIELARREFAHDHPHTTLASRK